MTFTLDWLRDPTRIHDRRLPAHSDHRWFASMDEATRGQSRYEHDLSGTWDLRYYPTPAALPPANALPALADEAQWESIPVPGHLQMHGFDRNRYVNTQYPWDGWESLEAGDAPWLHNPVGVYRRRFERPTLVHDDSRVRLRFEGAEQALAVWLNGQWVGYATDSFTPSEFDVTDALIDGTNTLLAIVFMWHAGSWVEDQDFFRFAGLHRPVSLLEVPATHVEHLHTRVDVSPTLDNARISVTLDGVNPTSAQVSLSAPDSATGGGGLDIPLMYEASEGAFVADLDQPRLWSDEDPYLYELTVTVSGGPGVVEVIPQKVGVRRFEIRDALLLLNGQRLVFRGVNRHEFGPHGRVVTPQMTTSDLLALKAIGCNAVRTSHYPNSSHLYAECDRLGLYVIDEMNLESHGLWDRLVMEKLPDECAVPGDYPQWLPTLLDRAESMLRRDVNHASILMWSCGNESYGGTNLLEVANYFRANDQRPVHYEGTFWDPRYTDTTDVMSSMYQWADNIRAYLAEHRDKPYIVCEYAHAMGNSFGAVDKYMTLTREEPLFHGGFIWDFSDQAVRIVSPDGTEYWGYGGDSGESPHDAEFCGNGIFFADHTPTPKIQEVRAVYAPLRLAVTADQVEVSNDLMFTSSVAYECRVSLAADGVEFASAVIETAVDPGESLTYALPDSVRLAATAAPGSEEAAREYTLTVTMHDPQAHEWAPAGHEIAFDQAVFRYECAPGQDGCCDQRVLTMLPQPGTAQALELITNSGEVCGPTQGGRLAKESTAHADAHAHEQGEQRVDGLRLVNGIHNIGIHGARFSIIFSKVYGGPLSYRYGKDGRGPDEGRQLLAVPPRLCFWHAQTSNERGWQSTFHDGQWLLASRYARVPKDAPAPLLTTTDTHAIVSYDYELPTTPMSYARVQYAVDAAGRVEVTMDVTPGEGLTDMPECGMLLAAPHELNTLRWYGEGPDECYIDRRNGARLGLYEDSVANQHTPYLRPQESGNRTGVRWAEVVDANGEGLRLDAAGSPIGMEFSAQPWNPYEVETARHDHELPPASYTWLRPALMRRGVGGDDSWGSRTHPEYCLPQGVPLRFTFAFQGIGGE